MSFSLRLLAALVSPACFISAVTAAAAQPETLFSDDFATGVGPAWKTTHPAFSLSAVTAPAQSPSAGKPAAVYAHTGAGDKADDRHAAGATFPPVTLQPGETLTLSLDYKGVSYEANTGNRILFGLADSNGSGSLAGGRGYLAGIRADARSGRPGGQAAAHGNFYQFDAGLPGRHDAGSLGRELDGKGFYFYGAPATPDAGGNLADAFHLVFAITRKPAGDMTLRASWKNITTGQACAIITALPAGQTAAPLTRFDTLAIGGARRGNTFAITNVTVTRTAAPVIAADPLEKTSAYSLEITPDGLPTKNYFPIGLRSGGTPPQVVRLVAHAGFNLWQDYQVARPENNKAITTTKRGADDTAALFTHGMFGYTQAKDQSMPPGADGKPLDMKKLPAEAPGYGLVTLGMNEDGDPGRLSSGSKLAFNIFSPGRRAHHLAKKRVTGEVVGATWPLGKPTLFWGMENEWEGSLNYAPEAKAAFADWLAKTYDNNIAALNEAWAPDVSSAAAAAARYPKNTAFTVAAAASVSAPAYKTFAEAAANPARGDDFVLRPGAYLDWYTFQSEAFTDFQSESAHTLNEADPLHRPVVYKSTQQSIDMPIVMRTRGTFDHERFANLMRDISGGLYGVNIYGSGDRQAYEINYTYHCIQPLAAQPGPYGVMTPEMNNHNGPGDQWAATYWRVLPNGLKATNYFAPGYKGAKNDYATFGHIDSVTGLPRDKMFYAARWAHMIHRTEALWKNVQPAAALPKVALLLPRRDALIGLTAPNTPSKWASPENNRVQLYRWLRQQGYWVDILPYDKLAAPYLTPARYQALFLAGAEHLTPAETAAITGYVETGGLLVADERPGHYDEHHRVRRQFENLLGLAFKRWDKATRYELSGDYKGITVNGLVPFDVRTATVLEKTPDGHPLVTQRSQGKGRVLHFAFRLGSMYSPDDVENLRQLYEATAENTADTGEDFVEKSTARFREGRLIAAYLARNRIRPAYTVKSPKAQNALQPWVRLEQPNTDANGNLVLTYSTDASRRTRDRQPVFPAATAELTLPGGPWSVAVYAPAEHAGLGLLPLQALGDDRYRIALPELETAGVIYLLKNHAPLLGIPRIRGIALAPDKHAARVKPGQTFPVTVQLLQPAASLPAGGALRLEALEGWTVAPEKITTDALPPDTIREYTFQVTVPADAATHPGPDLPPLVARWNDGRQQDRAICTANVELLPPSP
ncbi:beta-galactosidase [Opitutaceae bacterium TAV1]|nr:beta-galactosidase [Opitutaceae bacterium TAV1]